jgi:hypothetical protein
VWVILRSTHKLGDSVPLEQLLLFARRSGLRCGGLPTDDGFELAVAGGFVSLDDEIVRLTDLGKEALARGSEEEPTRAVLRLFMSVYLLRQPPTWVAYWQGDPSSLDIVMPDSARDLLRQADLNWPPPSEDLEAWAWWDALAGVPVLEETASHRKSIGDAAERLSFDFERSRLRQEGYPDLAEQVRWVARESPAYGFDILSFFGSSLDPQLPTRPLGVEVKGMSLAARGEFRFYLTSHEWKTALRLRGAYLFHLWDGVHPHDNSGRAERGPVLRRAMTLTHHLPEPPGCEGGCQWQSALVVLPLAEEPEGVVH